MVDGRSGRFTASEDRIILEEVGKVLNVDSQDLENLAVVWAETGKDLQKKAMRAVQARLMRPKYTPAHYKNHFERRLRAGLCSKRRLSSEERVFAAYGRQLSEPRTWAASTRAIGRSMESLRPLSAGIGIPGADPTANMPGRRLWTDEELKLLLASTHVAGCSRCQEALGEDYSRLASVVESCDSSVPAEVSHSFQFWSRVSAPLGRSPTACRAKWYQRNAPRGSWTRQEKVSVLKRVLELDPGIVRFSDIDWPSVAAAVPPRNAKQCHLRLRQLVERHFDGQQFIRGYFTGEERLIAKTSQEIIPIEPGCSHLITAVKYVLDQHKESSTHSVSQDDAVHSSN